MRSDDFLSQLSGSSAQTIAREKGQKIWSGTLDAKSELNRDVLTAFPVTEAVGKLEPGVYVMTARPPASRAQLARRTRTTTTGARRSGSWCPTSVSPPSRARTACTCWCARWPAPSRVRASRSGWSPATTRSSPARRPTPPATRRFDPGLARGEGGLAPGLVVASTEAGRLRLPRLRPRRLRSRRPRREGRARAGRGSTLTCSPNAACTAPARRCS